MTRPDHQKVRLTQFSHGAGCGCKIAPDVLKTILQTRLPAVDRGALIVGHEHSDDAAVFDVGNGMGIVSTTDFFMPIVDDPDQFGRIAVTNALSDVYAMGGQPIMAIAILGWPLDRLSPGIANAVVEGGRKACRDAGIALAGGHSIDSPEPIFGAAVTGTVAIGRLKRNASAQPGDELFLTKPLGIGVLTTAEKKGLLRPQHAGLAVDWMTRLNRIGADLAKLEVVHAMTDVTGFGLAGHLLEMCRPGSLSATIDAANLPIIPGVLDYIGAGAVPGGSGRNDAAYGKDLTAGGSIRTVMCDPQTSGGLLIAAAPQSAAALRSLAVRSGTELHCIGRFERASEGPHIRVS